MTDISDLVARLREAADPTIDNDNPWWWDCPDKGGPAQLLRDAADAFESPNMIDLALYALMNIQKDHVNDIEHLHEVFETLKAMKTKAEAPPCCDVEKTRGPNVSGEMVCPIHCSKCGHERKFEDYFDFCSECQFGDPCYRK